MAGKHVRGIALNCMVSGRLQSFVPHRPPNSRIRDLQEFTHFYGEQFGLQSTGRNGGVSGGQTILGPIRSQPGGAGSKNNSLLSGNIRRILIHN
jgi:hypothetical protein